MENAKWFPSSYLKWKMENGILHFKQVFEMDSLEIGTQLWPFLSSDYPFQREIRIILLLRQSGSDQMSNYNNFSKIFHARCKIPNIVRKKIFRYNLLSIPIMTGKKKCFPLIYNLYLTLGVFLSVNFGNHRAAPITRDPRDPISNRELTRRDDNYGVIVS